MFQDSLAPSADPLWEAIECQRKWNWNWLIRVLPLCPSTLLNWTTADLRRLDRHQFHLVATWTLLRKAMGRPWQHAGEWVALGVKGQKVSRMFCLQDAMVPCHSGRTAWCTQCGHGLSLSCQCLDAWSRLDLVWRCPFAQGCSCLCQLRCVRFDCLFLSASHIPVIFDDFWYVCWGCAQQQTSGCHWKSRKIIWEGAAVGPCKFSGGPWNNTGMKRDFRSKGENRFKTAETTRSNGW